MAERRIQLIACAGLVTILAGCAGLPAGPGAAGSERYPDTDGERRERYPDTGSERRERVMNPASASLLQQSRAQQRDGNLAQAAATLERAVRIDPGEAAVWLELARVRYLESNWVQAEQLARKARSLAGDDPRLAAAAIELAADALVMQGRPTEARQLRESGAG